MRKNGKNVIGLAVAGVILLSGIGAGFAMQKGGARAGREYIEETVKEERETVANKPTDTLETEEAGQSETEKMLAQVEEGDFGQRVEASIGPGETQSEEETSGEESRASAEIVMLFAGDVYLSNHVLNAYDQAGGIGGVLDEGIRAETLAADIFMVNQEFPFTERGTAAADKQFTFRVPESRMHLMQEMGVDIVTLANNHILDFGTVGLLDSCDALDRAGILYVGGGEDFNRASALKTIVIGDKTIGFLGTSRVYMDASWAAGDSHPGVFSTYDTTLPLEAIKEARDQCDYLVVYVHWGVEREETPKDYQKTMGRAYIDAGADLVVGSHPHVLQPMEEYNGKTIVYSLGNFVFGSSIPKTALLKVVWGEEGTEVSLIPCTSSGGYTRLVK